MGVRQTNNWFTVEGAAYPLGTTWIAAENAFNFALSSKHATSVTLLLFHPRDVTQPVLQNTVGPSGPQVGPHLALPSPQEGYARRAVLRLSN